MLFAEFVKSAEVTQSCSQRGKIVCFDTFWVIEFRKFVRVQVELKEFKFCFPSQVSTSFCGGYSFGLCQSANVWVASDGNAKLCLGEVSG